MYINELFESTEVKWKPARPSLIETGDYDIVWIDPRKFDPMYREETDFYVGSGGTGGIRTRYPDFGKWLEQGFVVEMPEVWIGKRFVDYGDYRVGFTNGRHRYAWMRDHGATAIPFQVPSECADEMRKRFGTSERKTILKNG